MYCDCKGNDEVNLIIDDHNNDRYYIKATKTQTIINVKELLKKELET